MAPAVSAYDPDPDPNYVSRASASSPTPSARSFLDEDPYPQGGLRHSSRSHIYHHPPASSSLSYPAMSGDAQVGEVVPPATALLTKLETLLRDKANEIHLAGQLGANLLAQQNELETRVREIAELHQSLVESAPLDASTNSRRARSGAAVNGGDSSDGEDKAVGEETKKRLEELENELRKWDESNQPLYQTVGMAAAQGLPNLDTTDTTESKTESDHDVFMSPPRTMSMQNNAAPPDSAPQHFRRAPGAVPAPLSQSTAAATSGAGAGAGTGDAATSRRARNNAQHRNNDIELATEIGQSLLSEVRRLQALLAEKEEQMRDGLKERDALESELENEKSMRRTVEESVEKYKEENWNLELASQDLRSSFADSQSSLQKADLERQRALRDLATTRETLDTQRSEAEKLAQQLEAFKQKHETDMANMRKQTAGLQRDKSDLQGTLEGLKTELATRARGIKRGGSAQGLDGAAAGDDSFDDDRRGDDDGDDDDVFRGGARRKTGDGFPPGSPGDLFSEYADESPAGSPVQRPGFLGTPDDSLKSGLAHAQRTIATLRASLAREKATKMELRRQLADNGIAWEDETEGGDGLSSRDVTPARHHTPGSARGSVRGSARGRGSARRRGGAAIGVPSRLRQFAGDTSIDEEEEEEGAGGEMMDGFDRASLFEHQFPSVEDDYSEIDSPIRHGRDLSLEDAAPLSDDDASIRSRRSSLHQTTNLGDVLGGLGVTSVRRESLISLSSVASAARESVRAITPEPIAAAPVEPVKPPVVWSNASIMTDPLPVPPPPEPVTITVYVPEPRPQSAEIGVQTDALPEPPVVPMVPAVVAAPVADPVVVKMVDTAGQTDPAHVVATKESGVSTEPIAMAEAGVSTDRVVLSEIQVQTDPLPEPVNAEVVAMPVDPAEMEDKALVAQPSLSSLRIGKLFGAFGRSGSTAAPDLPEIQRSATSSTIGGFRTATEGTENEEETETETETETDSDFEDARETIGGASPFAPSMHSRAGSASDFVSVRSGTSTSFNTARYNNARATDDSDLDDNIEVLRTPLGPRNGREWSSARDAVVPPKPTLVVVEAGVQTDAWQPAVMDTPRPRTPTTPGFETSNRDRDSINTLGRAESPDPLDDSVARASAFISGAVPSTSAMERAFSPDQSRPDSVVSMFSQTTTDAGSAPPLSPSGDKGKQPATVAAGAATRMGPPPTPARRGASPGHSAGRTGTLPRKNTASRTSHGSLRAPPRPTSPPPADLLYRAQSPAFDDDYARRQSTLHVPGSSATMRSTPSRGSSLQNLRPQQSMTGLSDRNASRKSFGTKSRSSTVSRAGGSAVPPLPIGPPVSSSARSVSELSMHSEVSRRPSIASSRTSEGGLFDTRHDADEPMRGPGDSTDPAVIHAITQTMIGEFLYKYTRRAIGKGISEKRHKRFFWVHPYTKTLYWSTSDPGGVNTNQSSAKSVCIEGVRQVLDANPMPPGLHQGSIVIQTPNREMKITASTRERHDMWFNAINYLLARPDEVAEPDTPNSRRGPNGSNVPSSPHTQRTVSRFRSEQNDYSLTPNANKMYNLGGSASDSRLTPKQHSSNSRGAASATVGSKKLSSATFGSSYKRHGTPANDYQRYTEFGSPRSARTYSFHGDESIEFVDRREIPAEMGDDEDDETWEGLENVRACCDGKHDVGSLSRRGGSGAHHHHHHHHSHSSRRSGRHSEGESLSMPTTPQRSRSKSALGTVGSNFSKRFNASSTSISAAGGRKAEMPSGPPTLAPATPLAPLTMNISR